MIAIFPVLHRSEVSVRAASCIVAKGKGKRGMRHELYSSIDELLSPEVLSPLAGCHIREVRRLPRSMADSYSGCAIHFLAIETNGGPGPRFILKRISREWDWIMRATDDRRGRSAAIWQHGLLDRLPPEIAHGVVGCAVDGTGWAILMHDLSAGLMPDGDQPLSVEENERFLDAMAALHTTFWEHPVLADPALGLCSTWHLYTSFSAATGCREVGGPDLVPPALVEGWELLPRVVEADIAELLGALLDDPQPLCAALARYPQTLIHGEWRLANLGLLSGARTRVILLDWQFAGVAPPAVDLAHYLATNYLRLPISMDAAITHYGERLAQRLGCRFDAGWWQPQLELGLLGGLVHWACLKAHGATHGEHEDVRARERANLQWFCEQARAGAQWL